MRFWTQFNWTRFKNSKKVEKWPDGKNNGGFGFSGPDSPKTLENYKIGDKSRSTKSFKIAKFLF